MQSQKLNYTVGPQHWSIPCDNKQLQQCIEPMCMFSLLLKTLISSVFRRVVDIIILLLGFFQYAYRRPTIERSTLLLQACCCTRKQTNIFVHRRNIFAYCDRQLRSNENISVKSNVMSNLANGVVKSRTKQQYCV